MGIKKHPRKDVDAAITYALSKGWRISLSSGRGHAWGEMKCPWKDWDCRCGEFCISRIWSTPKNSGNHAKQIRRVVDNCTGMPLKAKGPGVARENLN